MNILERWINSYNISLAIAAAIKWPDGIILLFIKQYSAHRIRADRRSPVEYFHPKHERQFTVQ